MSKRKKAGERINIFGDRQPSSDLERVVDMLVNGEINYRVADSVKGLLNQRTNDRRTALRMAIEAKKEGVDAIDVTGTAQGQIGSGPRQ